MQHPSRWVQTKLELHRDPLGIEDDVSDVTEEAEVNEIRFFNPAFLSEAALQLRDRVKRSRHTKAGIAWVNSFTGRDIVDAIQDFLPRNTRRSADDRRFALIMARSLQDQLWFVEVDWDIKPLRDSDEDVFRFMSQMEGALTSDLPSGVMTMATKCYSPSCTGDGWCYARACPYKSRVSDFIPERPLPTPAPSIKRRGADWTEDLDPELFHSLSQEQKQRQSIIRRAMTAEEQYEKDLTDLEQVFVSGLRHENLMTEASISQIFANVLAIRDASRALLDNFQVRLREQAPLIATVGDIFLETATVFRSLYPEYIGNLPQAEKTLTRAREENVQFRLFVDRVSRDSALDLDRLIARPSAHLQRFPVVLESLLQATPVDDPDYDFIAEALTSIQDLSAIAQLKLFHASRGRGPGSKIEWYEIVPQQVRDSMEKKEFQRQMHIWQLILSEMQYVSDLEIVDNLFVHGLRAADRPVVDRSRLDEFIDDAFHNYRSLLDVHTTLLEGLQQRQIEQHPRFGMVSDLVLHAVLEWRGAYLEYIPHYPLAKAKVEEERNRNPAFAAFLEQCQHDPMADRHDVYHFIHRPVARLLRYPLILKDILESLQATGPDDHPDLEAIPQVLELIADLGRATQKGVAVNEAKVDLWKYQDSLVDRSKPDSRVVKDLDLRNPMRELIHKGRVFRQSERSTGSWSELQVLLFDHYLVLTKPIKSSKNTKDGPTLYSVYKKPIALELLTLGSFSEPAQSRSLGLLKSIRGGTTYEDSTTHTVYPFTFSFIGQLQVAGQYTLWTDSAQSRDEWNEKLQHAKVLRAELNEANKLFDMTPLSRDTFFMPPSYSAPTNSDYTGRVTCSCPFATADGRALVAIGCQEGVWIGVRHDPRSVRQVLHVREVQQIAVLEKFGMFLVLADKSLLAYQLEALVPTLANSTMKAAPQRLSSARDISYFAVGMSQGRTLVMYTKRKHQETVFRILEPIANAPTEQRRGIGAILGGSKNEWFRLFKDFFIPTEALRIHFLKSKLAIVCSKGFEIMDLTTMRGSAIPIFDAAKLKEKQSFAALKERCDSAKPLAMFRSTETEFLLCYDTFGVYVDRNGKPSRDLRPIEWEGQPESVVFHPPYILVVSPSFMEIRHISTCRLIQIVTGSDIRVTWEAWETSDSPGPKGYGDEVATREPRVHICRRPEDSRRTRGIGQHVFELTPTVLLSNPLLAPHFTSDAQYFAPAPNVYPRPSPQSHHRSMSIATSFDSSPSPVDHGYTPFPSAHPYQTGGLNSRPSGPSDGYFAGHPNQYESMRQGWGAPETGWQVSSPASRQPDNGYGR
ncbi:Rho guanine nucleotide exchange factor [Cryptotrichosporon argae]